MVNVRGGYFLSAFVWATRSNVSLLGMGCHLKLFVDDNNRLSASNIMEGIKHGLHNRSLKEVFDHLKKLAYEYKVALEKQWLNARHHE